MFYDILDKKRLDMLPLLKVFKKDFYLAGGTALALQINHRFSSDFDFFTQTEFNAAILPQRIKKIIPDFELDRTDWGTILGAIGKTKFSLFF